MFIYCHFLGSEVIAIYLVKATTKILRFLVIGEKIDIVTFYSLFCTEVKWT